MDQRHGLDAAKQVLALAPERPDLVPPALLHDVGKRHSRLGVIGRVFATIAKAFGWVWLPRVRSYVDHGLIGGRELADAGSSNLTVDFAVHHATARPASMEGEIWGILHGADDAPKTLAQLARWILLRRR